MGRFLPILIAIILAIYALVDLAQVEKERVALMPKWAWVIVILVLPYLGPIGWLIFGRTSWGGGGGGGDDDPVPAPDNDPEFLKTL